MVDKQRPYSSIVVDGVEQAPSRAMLYPVGFTEEDFKTITVYRPEIARYLLALDNHIQNAPSFHRLIYAKISDGTGFSRRRQQVKQLLAEWESEVSQWENSVVLLWKRLASPLRILLGLK